MKAYKCSLCGGTILPLPDWQTGKCEYCKTVLPLLTDHSETVMNYMNRATDYRLACDYDRAIQIYDEVLKLSSTDPEAHWGMLLCKYGVEYVKDATTAVYSIGKLTLHRLSTVTVFDDPDYQAAIRYASPTNKVTYEERANEINKALQAALEEVRAAAPFDIFLSYKEKDDETGIRTDDSYFVYDLYNELTGRGYKVFFAPKSLGAGVFESKIYAALVSSKTMLVVGSKVSYFDAVWVKNEWKRFLEMKKRGENKQIIPVFRNASPQIIPVELAGENALDANTIDFFPRLIEMLDDKKENKPSAQAAAPAQAATATTESLLKRAFMFLEDGEWQSADEYAEKVLDIDPENARSYLCKLMAEQRAHRQEDLANCEHPFDSSNNYWKAVRFGDTELKEELSSYIKQINERNEIEIRAVAHIMKIGLQTQALQIELSETISQWQMLTVQQSKLGLFAGKKKKRIDEELADIAAKKTELTEQIARQQEMTVLGRKYSFEEALNIYLNEPIVTEGVNSIYPVAPLIPAFQGKTNTIIFGRYIQKEDGSPEPIEWQVLAREPGRMLVISKHALDCQQYNDSGAIVHWETCSLRRWLNSTFINTAFSSEEHNTITCSTVTADRNSSHRASIGDNTNDKVFLLSIMEVNKYIKSNDARKCASTDYARAQGAHNRFGTCWWWLRSRGSFFSDTAYVDLNGTVNDIGRNAQSRDGAVRPAMWIDLEL